MTDTPTTRATIALQRWLVVLALLLGCAVLLHGAGTRHMRPDEGHTFESTSTTLGDTIEAVARDVHAPLYFVVFYGWRQVVGDGEFTGRVLAVLLSMVTLALVFRLGARWFRPAGRMRARWVGLAALLALAVSAYFYLYTLEIRPYPLLILAGTACMVAFGRWLDRPTWWRAAWWTLSAAALLYVHYIGAFLLLAQAGYFLISRIAGRDQPAGEGGFYPMLRQATAAGVGTVILWLPWLPTFITQVQHEGALVTDGAVGGIGKAGSTLPTTWPTINGLLNLTANDIPLLALVLIGFGLFGWWRVRRYWLAMLWGIGVPVALLLINLVVPLYEPRYVAYITPGLALLYGAGIVGLSAREWRPLLMGALLLVYGLFTVTDAVPDRTPVRDYLRALEAAFQPGDVVLLDQFYVDGWLSYQLDQYAPNVSAHLYSLEPMRDPVQPLDSLADLPRCVWHANGDWFNDDIRATFRALEAARPMVQLIGSDQDWLFQRLCAPPLADPVQFGDSFGFMGVDMVAVEADAIRLNLWWRLSDSPAADYSFGVHLLAPDGSLAAQSDGPLIDYWSQAAINTSALEPDRLYLDDRLIDLPPDLPPGEYRLSLVIYQPWDGVRLPLADGGDALTLLTLTLP
jgi:mannosyltransferase